MSNDEMINELQEAKAAAESAKDAKLKADEHLAQIARKVADAADVSDIDSAMKVETELSKLHFSIMHRIGSHHLSAPKVGSIVSFKANPKLPPVVRIVRSVAYTFGEGGLKCRANLCKPTKSWEDPSNIKWGFDSVPIQDLSPVNKDDCEWIPDRREWVLK